MTRAVAIKGFRLSKAGRIERDQRRLSVSERLRQKGSKRIKPARKGQAA
jgi:hypothetical protein